MIWLGIAIGFVLGAVFWLYAIGAMMRRVRPLAPARVVNVCACGERHESLGLDTAWRPVTREEGARLDGEMEGARAAIAEAVKPLMVSSEDQEWFQAACLGVPSYLVRPEEQADWVNGQRRRLGLEPLEDRLM